MIPASQVQHLIQSHVPTQRVQRTISLAALTSANITNALKGRREHIGDPMHGLTLTYKTGDFTLSARRPFTDEDITNLTSQLTEAGYVIATKSPFTFHPIISGPISVPTTTITIVPPTTTTTIVPPTTTTTIVPPISTTTIVPPISTDTTPTTI